LEIYKNKCGFYPDQGPTDITGSLSHSACSERLDDFMGRIPSNDPKQGKYKYYGTDNSFCIAAQLYTTSSPIIDADNAGVCSNLDASDFTNIGGGGEVLEILY